MQKRLAGLDGLRGLAVAAVVAFHLGWAKTGYVGVDVFFVLSGFLITRILVRHHGTPASVINFTRRRLLRLYPALAVLVVFVVMVSVATGRQIPTTLGDAVKALTYTGNLLPLHGLLDHVWTLGLEEQFYLLWPPLLILCRRVPRLHYAPALVLVAALLLADLAHGQQGALHSFVRAMGLPLGCALALASPTMVRRMALIGPVCLAALGVAIWLPDLLSVMTGWPVSAAAVLTVPVVAWLSHGCPRWLASATPQWLGLRSYSLYLWHFPLISLAVHHAPASVPHLVRLLIALAASLLACALSYRLVERPVLDWRDRRRPDVTSWVTA